jgi:hypothetical protein
MRGTHSFYGLLMLAVCLTVLLNGCTCPDCCQGANSTKVQASDSPYKLVRIGMSQQQVLDLLGHPTQEGLRGGNVPLRDQSSVAYLRRLGMGSRSLGYPVDGWLVWLEFNMFDQLIAVKATPPEEKSGSNP